MSLAVCILRVKVLKKQSLSIVLTSGLACIVLFQTSLWPKTPWHALTNTVRSLSQQTLHALARRNGSPVS